jgi:hypothetical protein
MQSNLRRPLPKLEEDVLSFSRFEKWLHEGRQGSMHWLEKYSLQRKNSSLVEAGCTTYLAGCEFFFASGAKIFAALRQFMSLVWYADLRRANIM